MYMGKWITGIISLLTGGIIGVGVIYDFWKLNDQIAAINSAELNAPFYFHARKHKLSEDDGLED